MRAHYAWDAKAERFVDAETYYAAKAKLAARARSLLPSPHFISDDLPGGSLLNHADNRTYTSKAEYVRAVKAAGCEIVGSDKLPRREKKQFKLSDGAKREIRERVRSKWDGKKPRM